MSAKTNGNLIHAMNCVGGFNKAYFSFFYPFVRLDKIDYYFNQKMFHFFIFCFHSNNHIENLIFIDRIVYVLKTKFLISGSVLLKNN